MARFTEAVHCEVCPSGSFSEVHQLSHWLVGFRWLGWFGWWVKSFGYSYLNNNLLSWGGMILLGVFLVGVCLVNIQRQNSYITKFGG